MTRVAQHKTDGDLGHDELTVSILEVSIAEKDEDS